MPPKNFNMFVSWIFVTKHCHGYILQHIFWFHYFKNYYRDTAQHNNNHWSQMWTQYPRTTTHLLFNFLSFFFQIVLFAFFYEPQFPPKIGEQWYHKNLTPRIPIPLLGIIWEAQGCTCWNVTMFSWVTKLQLHSTSKRMTDW